MFKFLIRLAIGLYVGLMCIIWFDIISSYFSLNVIVLKASFLHLQVFTRKYYTLKRMLYIWYFISLITRNIVSTVNLSCKLDLKKIALHARNAEYNPKVGNIFFFQKFACAFMEYRCLFLAIVMKSIIW